jgi:uncharacterized membrane protein YjdF
MEILIAFLCFLLFTLISIALVAVAYYRYTKETTLSKLFFRLILATVGFVIITIFIFYYVGLVMLGGAHSEPLGQTLNTFGRVLFFFLALVYGVCGWLLCSLVNGNFIAPRFLKAVKSQ